MPSIKNPHRRLETQASISKQPVDLHLNHANLATKTQQNAITLGREPSRTRWEAASTWSPFAIVGFLRSPLLVRIQPNSGGERDVRKGVRTDENERGRIREKRKKGRNS
ncbi:hypothetical protein SO802_012499 [Lithocarpus litseifolius]|uniref:Uncharacterized protein n=1 Tax=Lithocarpus litseifolius TaxID=425828 RepID=A0AAW2D2W6_9ROSI